MEKEEEVTQFTNLILDELSVELATKVYFRRVISELIQENFKDEVTKNSIKISKKDFFWGVVLGLEELSIELDGEPFTNDEDDNWKLIGIKPLLNKN